MCTWYRLGPSAGLTWDVGLSAAGQCRRCCGEHISRAMHVVLYLLPLFSLIVIVVYCSPFLRYFLFWVFIGVTIIGFIKHGIKYLELFVPKGVPKILLPLIIVIEIISYLSRPVSLSVRLFANMMAGHTMLKVFGGFVISLGLLGGWLPLSFSVALTGLEILIAFLQAYVFAILTCIYLNDALNLHH